MHQAQGRHRADVHLLSGLLLAVVQGWLRLEVIRGCQCQLRMETRRSALLVLLESKPRRPLTFGSWLAERVVGLAGCVEATCLAVADLFLLSPSSA